MKKLLLVVTSLLIVFGFSACGNKEQITELDFMVNFGQQEAITTALEETIADFEEANPQIRINLIPGDSEYENLMKTKMGANDLPDMWTTHGWSVARYSEYLLPLNDQSWVAEISPMIKDVVTSKNGDVFVLPVDVDVAGIAYNRDVLATAGVNVDDIKTWDDFFDACETIKGAGITPVHMGGKDNWTIGNFFDWVAPSLLITDEASNYRTELKDGSFVWSNWQPVADLLRQLQSNEYINEDVLGAIYSDSAQALANGTAAFGFYGNYVIAEALTYNADANLGFMPVPSNSANDDPTLISGERTAIGIWKDSEHAAEAKLFLEYLTTPEVMSKLASANGIPAGLTGITADTGILAPDFAKYSNYRGFPYFDREYLPSGMWDTMCSTGTGILNGSMTNEDAANQMETDYNNLR